MINPRLHDEVLRLLPVREGHFRLESGHHGAMWLELERLCIDPVPVQRLAGQLAESLGSYRPQVICGPLVEGAFIALGVAAALSVQFIYAERIAHASPTNTDALFAVQYRIPAALRGDVHGKRVAIVNDVINAGSAVRGTLSDLRACEAKPVAIGTLLTLGDPAARFAAAERLQLHTLATLPNQIWPPAQCPLCAQGIPLSRSCSA